MDAVGARARRNRTAVGDEILSMCELNEMYESFKGEFDSEALVEI